MSFKSVSKNKELTYILQLVSIFGCVETKQMREMFSHLSDQKYGKILAKLHREKSITYEDDGRYLASNRYASKKINRQDSINTFWVLIQIKDQITDFCCGESPAILSCTSGEKDYDLIPVRKDNIEIIKENGRTIPPNTNRLLIVPSIQETKGMEYRIRNDYVAVVSADGKTTTYRI